jgi:hypothetical protein
MRTEVGVSKRRWAGFIEESVMMRSALFNMDDEDEEDDAFVRAGEQADEDDEDEVDDEVDDAGDEHDACDRPFGFLELSPEDGVVGWQWINELLSCVRSRDRGMQIESIRCLRAQIESLRCNCARDLGIHAMASSIAEWALGEHEGLPARVDHARAMHDNAFMATGAMMIALETGNLPAARELARDAVSRYPHEPMVLRQAGTVYQAVCEFRESIEVLSALFDIAERDNASWDLKCGLAFEIEEISDFLVRAESRGVDEPVFARAMDLAISMARERGYAILGVNVSSLGDESEGIEIQIDGSSDECRRLYFAFCDAYIDRCGEEAYYRLLFTYESWFYEAIATNAESAERGMQCR